MAMYSLDQLVGWVNNAGPRVTSVGNQLQNTRSRIAQLYRNLESLELNLQRLRSMEASLQSQISSLASQAGSSDEEDDSGAQEIENQISQLQARLAEVESTIAQTETAIAAAEAELQQRQQEEQVHCAKLREMDGALEEIDTHLTDNLRERVAAKEKFTRLSQMRFGGADATASMQQIQTTINACMGAQSRLRNMRNWISELLGDEHDEPQKVLTKRIR